MIYIITDLHFNHKTEMIAYCRRPVNYEEIIIKGLKEIKKEDVLICLGDICIGNDLKVHKKYIKPLKCKKILIKGNHDSKSDHWYMTHGWDVVCNTMTIKMYGKLICFSHIPQYLRTSDNGSDIYELNIHGHFHNVSKRSEEAEMIARKHYRQMLLAIENTNYRPVSLKSLVEKFNRLQISDKDKNIPEIL